MQKILHFCANKRGLAAVEFALVLPIILAMFLGLIELSHASGVRAQVVNMAATAADLIAQESVATGSDMDVAFAAVNAVIFPHKINAADGADSTTTITSVIDAGAGKTPIVAWSCSKGKAPSAKAKGSNPSPALPPGLLDAGSGGSVIWSHVDYKYTSFLSYFLPASNPWTNDFYEKPRRVKQITLSAAPAYCNS